jgi:hypothetical protein
MNRAPFDGNGPPSHRLFAIEYYNAELKGRPGRLFKKPDKDDLARVKAAEAAWQGTTVRFVPEDLIPEGDESSRLQRSDYQRFRELLNTRQLLGLETSARMIARVEDTRVRRALATNLSDLLRYQNMLCRYDTMALKSLDIFSIHGFRSGMCRLSPTFSASATATLSLWAPAAGSTSSRNTRRRNAIARRPSRSHSKARTK